MNDFKGNFVLMLRNDLILLDKDVLRYLCFEPMDCFSIVRAWFIILSN